MTSTTTGREYKAFALALKPGTETAAAMAQRRKYKAPALALERDTAHVSEPRLNSRKY